MKLGCFVMSALALVVCYPADAFPCTRVSPVSTPDMVRDAEVIVRAIAVEYVKPPSDPNIWTTGEPDSRVRFKIVEVLRGKDLPAELTLPAYLSDRDDFNDHEPPYRFVRPDGRGGSCFANTYRTGAQFLLFLKSRNGTYTVNWYALGPVNEQLRSDQDGWLLWVREQAKQQVGLWGRRASRLAGRSPK